MNTIPNSYLLWLGWFFGLGGLHRIYNKKFFSGFLWLFTMGLLGVGQFIDLLLIPNMVDEHNSKVRRKLGVSAYGVPLGYDAEKSSLLESLQKQNISPVGSLAVESISQEQLMIILARAAQNRGGKISVTQAVVDTGISFKEIQAALNEMVKQGYVGIDNHPNTGVVMYDFLEL
jgi:TM2 domain-containing membrane protein YozV